MNKQGEMLPLTLIAKVNHCCSFANSHPNYPLVVSLNFYLVLFPKSPAALAMSRNLGRESVEMGIERTHIFVKMGPQRLARFSRSGKVVGQVADISGAGWEQGSRSTGGSVDLNEHTNGNHLATKTTGLN